MQSVLDSLLTHPMYILSPNWETWINIRAEPQISCCLNSKVKAPSSTYRINNISNRRPLVNVFNRVLLVVHSHGFNSNVCALSTCVDPPWSIILPMFQKRP